MRSKEVAIIGAGKIGRGFLADLFGRAGYHLIFINGSPKTIDKLNEQKQYTLFTTGPEGTTRKIISGYEAYSSQRDFDTVGGLVTDRLGRIPAPGEAVRVEWGGAAFTVLEAGERRVNKVLCQTLAGPGPEKEN